MWATRTQQSNVSHAPPPATASQTHANSAATSAATARAIIKQTGEAAALFHKHHPTTIKIHLPILETHSASRGMKTAAFALILAGILDAKTGVIWIEIAPPVNKVRAARVQQ